jgi:hypothetical protein
VGTDQCRVVRTISLMALSRDENRVLSLNNYAITRIFRSKKKKIIMPLNSTRHVFLQETRHIQPPKTAVLLEVPTFYCYSLAFIYMHAQDSFFFVTKILSPAADLYWSCEQFPIPAPQQTPYGALQSHTNRYFFFKTPTGQPSHPKKKKREKKTLSRSRISIS